MGQYFSYLSSMANVPYMPSSYFADKNFLIFTSASDEELKALDLLITTRPDSTFVLVITPGNQLEKAKFIHDYCDVEGRQLDVKYVINPSPFISTGTTIGRKYFIASVDIMHIVWRHIHMIVLCHSEKTMECMRYVDHTDIVSIKCHGSWDEQDLLCPELINNIDEVCKLFNSFECIELYSNLMGIVISYVNSKFVLEVKKVHFDIIQSGMEYLMDNSNPKYKCCVVKTIDSEKFDDVMKEHVIIH
jgi:hypothetical protein